MVKYFEIFATIFGLIQGLLIMYNKRSNWIAYVIQMMFLIAFSALNHLYGDVANNTFYMVLGIIGFITWKREDKSIPEYCTLKQRFLIIAIIVIGTVLIWTVLTNTNDPLPLLDAFTTMSSLVATYYMITKKIDTWFIWFVNDIFYAIEYFILPDQAIYLFLLNVVWAFMAVGSFFTWNKIRREAHVIKLFCGGTFDFDFRNIDYKERSKNDYRAILLENAESFLQKHDSIPIGNNISYIGPFYFESEGMVDQQIVESEIQMIKDCTHVIFLLDEGCCPGTIAELVLAGNLNKNVELFYIRKKDDEETESRLHSPCWFPIIMSENINNAHTNITDCIDYKDAVQKILSYVNKLKIPK